MLEPVSLAEGCILDHRLVDMICPASLSLHTVSRESAAKLSLSHGPAWQFSKSSFRSPLMPDTRMDERMAHGLVLLASASISFYTASLLT